MLLAGFMFLQLLDALTTVVFLRQGIREANPLVQACLSWSARPELALAGPKLFAIALAVYAWRSGRIGLLRKMNVLFSLCVIWNMTAILSGQR